MKKWHFLIRIGGLAASFAFSSMLTAAFSPLAADDVTVYGDHAARRLTLSNEAESVIDDLHSPMPSSDYDALHSIQSGIRMPDEIQADIARVAGQGPVIQWSSDFWQKNKIKGPLKLVTVLSRVQNPETQTEVIHILNLPSEKSPEASVTLFTDRMNLAEISTLHSSLVIAKTIAFDNGRPAYDPKSLERFDFHLTTDDTDSSPSELREPDGAYKFSPVTASVSALDPLAELDQVDGSFDEVGNYTYTRMLNDQHCTVSVTPRWNAAKRPADRSSLSVEVKIHEAESLDTRSFVLVYQ